jgi:hypothetical protein
MNETLEERVATMKREVDALQIAITGHSKPWYQNISTLLSILALLFSFGTTFVSYRRTKSQDLQAARQELRGLLQRMTALPKENVEIMKKYPDDPASRNMVASYINQENTFLVRNAAEIAKGLPSEAVSATEYYAIALALQFAYDLNGANDFLARALVAKPDFNTKIAVLRTVANLHFVQGRPEAGRVEYQKALGIFSEYPGYDPYTKISTNVMTELSWAISEAANMGMPLARQHLESADAAMAPLPPSPGLDMLRSQIAQVRQNLQSGQPVAPPVAGPQVSAANAVAPAK